MQCSACRANLLDPTVLSALRGVRERIPFLHDRLFEAAKSYEQWLSTGSIALMKERLKIEGLPLEMPVRPFCRFRYL
jgi:hypothetical protein